MGRKKSIRITKNQLIGVAIQSVKQRSNLSMFWEYVNEARNHGILKMTDTTIRLLLQERELLIYDKGFEAQDAENKLPDNVVLEAPRTWRSGEHDVPDTPAENADIRTSVLVKDMADKYGWLANSDRSGYHHDILGLRVYCGKSIRLMVAGRDGVTRPCLQLSSHEGYDTIKDDTVASLLVTCIVDVSMAKHIDSYSPGFLDRWNKYHGKEAPWTEKSSSEPSLQERVTQLRRLLFRP